MEQVAALFDKQPQSAPETLRMKRTYNRAGLSVVTLYGAVSMSTPIASALIGMLAVCLFFFRLLPPFEIERYLHTPGYLMDYIGSLNGSGVIASMLAVFLLVQACAWIVGFVLMRLVLPKGTPILKRRLSFGRFLVIALMCFGVWGVGAALGNLSAFFGVETQNIFSVEMLGAEALPFLVYAVIGAPIVEELTFRKALCDRLHDTHEGYAAVISGLLFGLMHGNHQQFFLAFFIGMLFAMVYQRTGRIVYTMLLHGMINFTATLPEFFSLAGVDINLGWNIAVGALILAGLVVLLVKRKDPILHAAPCVVQDANNAVYRNLGMRIVRVAALVLIGVQGIILIFAAMAQSGFEHWALCLIDLIPLTLVFLTVFLLPAFTKCYERDFSKLHPKDCTEEAGV